MKRTAFRVFTAFFVLALMSSLDWGWLLRDDFVMVAVEESSTQALATWPLLYERTPQVFLDSKDQKLILPSKPSFLGVSMCVGYSAYSGGVLYAENVSLSRTGKVSLKLEKPIVFHVKTLDGAQINAVSNESRVILGNISVKRIGKDGAVEIFYGGRRQTLSCGEVFSELLALTPDGVVAIAEDRWAEMVDSFMEEGFPVTRLSVTNFGVWPKANIEAEACALGSR